MYIYVLTEKGIQTPHGTMNLYTVGHYDPKGNFIAESDFNTTDEAARRCGVLNGVSEMSIQKGR